ncbi:MAG: extracellular matrix/biofilm biosynthesis regulator RemA family protein [bacterium]
MQMLNIGYNNFLASNRVLAVLNPESAPMKRLREEARQSHALIDATQGRRTRSIILMDNGTVVLSGIQEVTLVQRLAAAGDSDT